MQTVLCLQILSVNHNSKFWLIRGAVSSQMLPLAFLNKCISKRKL
nr:MAG TPA: hypothetical protein [Caudoviricetes sp.]